MLDPLAKKYAFEETFLINPLQKQYFFLTPQQKHTLLQDRSIFQRLLYINIRQRPINRCPYRGHPGNKVLLYTRAPPIPTARLQSKNHPSPLEGCGAHTKGADARPMRARAFSHRAVDAPRSVLAARRRRRAEGLARTQGRSDARRSLRRPPPSSAVSRRPSS